MSEKYTLALNSYEIKMYLGIHKFEKETAQRVLVSAEINLLSGYLKGPIFDYDPLIKYLENTFSGKHIETQEELASTIADHILKDSRVAQVTIKTEKPDIFEKAGSIGFVYEKTCA
jgi:dihydroneopterin aldolase